MAFRRYCGRSKKRPNTMMTAARCGARCACGNGSTDQGKAQQYRCRARRGCGIERVGVVPVQRTKANGEVSWLIPKKQLIR
jgi:hypothetical protein